MNRMTFFLVGMAGIGAQAASAATVTFSLEHANIDPAAGETVQISPGAPVEWELRISNTDDNAGVCFVLADIAPDEANPEPVTLKPGVRPTGMATFDIPLGLANRAADGSSRFGGTPWGTVWNAVGLREVGGAQNTFQVAGPAGVLQGTTPVFGVGQETDGRVVLTGAFDAPLMYGVYRIKIWNARANVMLSDLSDADDREMFSFPVAPATTSAEDGDLVFEVDCTADINRDYQVTISDLVDFVRDFRAGDADYNEDGVTDISDLVAYIRDFRAGCEPGVPGSDEDLPDEIISGETASEIENADDEQEALQIMEQELNS